MGGGEEAINIAYTDSIRHGNLVCCMHSFMHVWGQRGISFELFILSVVIVMLYYTVYMHNTYTRYSSQPSYKLFAHLIVWGFSFTCGAVLAALTLKHVPGEAGDLVAIL